MKKENLCLQEFIKYSSLNVLGMIGLSCYILADTFFVSKALGADGLTALNLAIPVYSFIHGSGLMIGMGGGIKYAIVKSQKDADRADRIFTNAAALMVIIAGIFFLLGIFGTGFLVRLLGADEAVFEMTQTYLKVILLFAPMFMTNNLLLCFIRNDGAPQLSMTAMICGSLSNVVLDYVFMFPLGMGIFGAAFATGLAPVISILILMPFFVKKRNQFHLRKRRLSARLFCGIFLNGVPSLITEVSSGIVMIVFNTLLLGLAGNIGVAAYSVIANLSLVVISIYTGIAQGIQPIVSSNFGKGNRKHVEAILRYALIAAAVVSVLVYGVVFLGAEGIVSVFNSEQNAQLQEIAVTGMRIYFTACIFAGFNIIVAVYFTATEHALPAHIISLLRGFAVMIPMALALSAAGILGVWSAFPATELLVALLGAVMLLKRKKSHPSGVSVL